MIITNKPSSAFDKLAIDITGPFLVTENGNKYILTLQGLDKILQSIPAPKPKHFYQSRNVNKTFYLHTESNSVRTRC